MIYKTISLLTLVVAIFGSCARSGFDAVPVEVGQANSHVSDLSSSISKVGFGKNGKIEIRNETSNGLAKVKLPEIEFFVGPHPNELADEGHLLLEKYANEKLAHCLRYASADDARTEIELDKQLTATAGKTITGLRSVSYKSEGEVRFFTDADALELIGFVSKAVLPVCEQLSDRSRK